MNHSCLHFDGSSLQLCEPPEWYNAIERDADERGGDTQDIYRRNGVNLQYQFGEDLDSVYVYNAGRHGYLIEYWDANQRLAVILIDSIRAYLEFRAKYLHAWAWLIAESERLADADYEKTMKQHGKSS